MSALPTAYLRQADFSQNTVTNPSAPQPGAEMDAEFNAVKVSMDETQARLTEIQRDDGGLGNATVDINQLTPALRDLLGLSGGNQTFSTFGSTWVSLADTTAARNTLGLGDLALANGAATAGTNITYSANQFHFDGASAVGDGLTYSANKLVVNGGSLAGRAIDWNAATTEFDFNGTAVAGQSISWNPLTFQLDLDGPTLAGFGLDWNGNRFDLDGPGLAGPGLSWVGNQFSWSAATLTPLPRAPRSDDTFIITDTAGQSYSYEYGLLTQGGGVGTPTPFITGSVFPATDAQELRTVLAVDSRLRSEFMMG